MGNSLSLFIFQSMNIVYWIVFLIFFSMIVVRLVRICLLRHYMKDYDPNFDSFDENNIPKGWATFSTLLQQIHVASGQQKSEIVENRIDQVWINFQKDVAGDIQSINGLVNTVILVGFFGTLVGSFMALIDMGDLFVMSSESARMSGIANILKSKLGLAMISSIVASFIAAFATGILASRVGSRWVNEIAAKLNDFIFLAIGGANSCKDDNLTTRKPKPKFSVKDYK